MWDANWMSLCVRGLECLHLDIEGMRRINLAAQKVQQVASSGRRDLAANMLEQFALSRRQVTSEDDAESRS